MGTISIAVLASDPITGEGAVWCLRRYPDLTVLPQEEHRNADVALLITPDVTEDTMLLMESVAERSPRPGPGIVLVTGHIGEAHLLRAVRFGLRGVMWRQDTTYDKVVESVRAVAEGGAALPHPVQGQLLDHLMTVERDVLGPLGLTASAAAALGGLMSALALVHQDSRKAHQERNLLESRPGFVLLKAKELLDHA